MKSFRLQLVASVLGLAVLLVTAVQPRETGALAYERISGEGSSWAANALDAMRVNVRQFGISVDYSGTGSSAGRKNFLNGTVDFAASDIPFQFHPEDGSAPENPAPNSYAYIPVVAGGTAFMYNLKINGKRVTNLRLSGENVAKLFTGAITMWNDPAIQADNPGLVMPARPVVPVVRSDGSGSTAQFTKWMIATQPGIWNDYCARSGRAPACGFTSFYPTIKGMFAQNGDIGVAGYVSQGYGEGAIGYVNYSYALNAQFPVAKVLNAAGFYTEPTPRNVAVSLLKAQINTNANDPSVYLTQELGNVYTDGDPRNYQLSSYSYLIIPTQVMGQFTEAKGDTLSAFAYYAMCQAQQQSESLGYSPMPVNLVQASFDQIRKIPGAQVQQIDITKCNNPTFSPDGHNVLADKAPQPKACDRQGTEQCPDGTAGMANVPTAVANGPAAPAPGNQPAAQPGAPNPAAQQPGAQPGPANPNAAQPAAGDPAKPTPAGNQPAVNATPTDGSTATDATADAVALEGDGSATVAQCDPDTGVCPDGATTHAAAGTGAVAGATPGGAAFSPPAAVTTTLGNSEGWPAAALTLLIILLTLALIITPALAWQYYSSHRPPGAL